MIPVLLVLLTLGTRESLSANELSICIEDKVQLDADSRAEFTRELATIAAESGVSLGLRQCAAFEPGIHLTIQSQSASEPSALGAARVASGRVLPEVEVYVDPVAALLGTRLPVFVGRALARVAAHELGHYLLQNIGHASGLMAEGFTGARLMVKDRSSFRIPVSRAIALKPSGP